jgi:hypothetical protein
MRTFEEGEAIPYRVGAHSLGMPQFCTLDDVQRKGFVHDDAYDKHVKITVHVRVKYGRTAVHTVI